jgi:hypothetical protein
MSNDLHAPEHATPMIPGAYERTAPTCRQPGAMGGSPFGSATYGAPHASLDAATIADREREGGGAPSQRRRKERGQARMGPALKGTEDERSWLARGCAWFQTLRLVRR